MRRPDPRGPFPRAWEFATVAIAALAILAMGGIHALQAGELANDEKAISILGLARVDLAKCLLSAETVDAAAFGPGEALAFARQAAGRFEEARSLAYGRDRGLMEGTARDLQSAFELFSKYVEAIEPGQRGADQDLVRLRLAYRGIEKELEALDVGIKAHYAARSRTFRSQYSLALWLAYLLLVLSSAGIWLRTRHAAESQRALEDSQALLGAVIDNSPSLIYAYDREGRCVLSNRNHAALFGRDPQDMVGHRRNEWLLPADGAIHRANDLAIFEKREPAEYEESVGEGGGKRWYLTLKFLLPAAPGRAESVAGISTDITERKSVLVALEKALGEKDILLKELFHRTRNNMQVIMALLYLAADRATDPAASRIVTETIDRIMSMSLVHRKLYDSADLSRIDLADYAADLIALLNDGLSVGEARIRVRTELEQVFALIDTAVPFGLILHELVSNSFRHAFPEDREGELVVRLAKEPGGEVELCVSDDGVGLEGGLVEHLGLNLARELAEHQLGGRLFIESGEKGLRCRLVFLDPNTTERI